MVGLEQSSQGDSQMRQLKPSPPRAMKMRPKSGGKMRSYRELRSGGLSRENTAFSRGKQDGEKAEAKRPSEQALQGWRWTART